MIRIHKPRTRPAILTTRGVAKRKGYCAAFNAASKDYMSGDALFVFDGSIYGHIDVKNALIKAQHRKCCFCESQVGGDGDVEHFRPKSGSRQSLRTPRIRPGYYWLAYNWDNLYLSCTACNQRQKSDLFPLTDPKTRARSHSASITSETPLFIDPGKEDPAQHISFRKEIPYAVGGSKRGKATIESIGLHREIMNERRRDHRAHLIDMQLIIDQEHIQPWTPEWAQIVANAKTFVENSIKDDALFAGMARAHQRGW